MDNEDKTNLLILCRFEDVETLTISMELLSMPELFNITYHDVKELDEEVLIGNDTKLILAYGIGKDDWFVKSLERLMAKVIYYSTNGSPDSRLINFLTVVTDLKELKEKLLKVS
jgi:hypothetical protein